MTNDNMLGGVYLLMAMMLVIGSLMARRQPLARTAVMALSWIAIFGLGFVLFSFRDDLGFVMQRLKTEATGAPMAEGTVLRLPKAIDGHFYVDGMVNGHKLRFLVDSGATMTTIGRQSAAQANVAVGDSRDQMVMTGNGPIRVASARATTLNIGSIERSDVGLHIADGDEINVLGMNYLSSLKRWTVEGRWLVLEG